MCLATTKSFMPAFTRTRRWFTEVWMLYMYVFKTLHKLIMKAVRHALMWVICHLTPSLVSTATLKNRSHQMYLISRLWSPHINNHFTYKLTVTFDHNSQWLSVPHTLTWRQETLNLFVLTTSDLLCNLAVWHTFLFGTCTPIFSFTSSTLFLIF